MYLVPSREERLAIFFHQPQAFADVGVLHADSPDQFGFAVYAGEIDLGFSITEDVDMRRFMIV
jgi:hypothetical protein